MSLYNQLKKRLVNHKTFPTNAKKLHKMAGLDYSVTLSPNKLDALESKLKVGLNVENYRTPSRYFSHQVFLKYDELTELYTISKNTFVDEFWIFQQYENKRQSLITTQTPVTYCIKDGGEIVFYFETKNEECYYSVTLPPTTIYNKWFRDNKYLAIRQSKKEDDLQADYLKDKRDWDEINLYSNKDISVFGYGGSWAKTITQNFYRFCPTACFTPLLNKEAYFIKMSSSGGLIDLIQSDEPVEGEMVHYDINSCYPFILQTQTHFPVGEPTFLTITDIPPVIQYGIYRCKITFPTTMKIRPVRYNSNNYYTHFDLAAARLYKLKITMICDNEPNFMHYEGEKRATGTSLFKQYVDYMFDLKQKCSKDNKIIKLLLQRLWGVLCQKNIHKHTDKTIDTDDDVKIELGFNGSYLTVENDGFKYPHAKIKPFVLSKARLFLAKEIYPIFDKVKRIHTDSFHADADANISHLEIGTKLGEWKLEGKGYYTFKNVNIYSK